MLDAATAITRGGVLVGRNLDTTHFMEKNIYTYIHTFFLNLVFCLRNLKNIEIHQNLLFENFHRYKAFSLRKQNWPKFYFRKTLIIFFQQLCISQKMLKEPFSVQNRSKSKKNLVYKNYFERTYGPTVSSSSSFSSLFWLIRIRMYSEHSSVTIYF